MVSDHRRAAFISAVARATAAAAAGTALGVRLTSRLGSHPARRPGGRDRRHRPTGRATRRLARSGSRRRHHRRSSRRGCLVLFGAQARDALAIQVHAQGRAARDAHVDAQVELVPVEQQRLVHVLLRHALLAHLLARCVELVVRAADGDVDALTTAVGLDNEHARRLGAEHELAERRRLLGQLPAPRVEVVLEREGAAHALEYAGARCLVAQGRHVREMIDFLQREQRSNALVADRQVCPEEVPTRRRIGIPLILRSQHRIAERSGHRRHGPVLAH